MILSGPQTNRVSNRGLGHIFRRCFLLGSNNLIMGLPPASCLWYGTPKRHVAVQPQHSPKQDKHSSIFFRNTAGVWIDVSNLSGVTPPPSQAFGTGKVSVQMDIQTGYKQPTRRRTSGVCSAQTLFETLGIVTGEDVMLAFFFNSVHSKDSPEIAIKKGSNKPECSCLEMPFGSQKIRAFWHPKAPTSEPRMRRTPAYRHHLRQHLLGWRMAL